MVFWGVKRRPLFGRRTKLVRSLLVTARAACKSDRNVQSGSDSLSFHNTFPLARKEIITALNIHKASYMPWLVKLYTYHILKLCADFFVDRQLLTQTEEILHGLALNETLKWTRVAPAELSTMQKCLEYLPCSRDTWFISQPLWTLRSIRLPHQHFVNRHISEWDTQGYFWKIFISSDGSRSPI